MSKVPLPEGHTAITPYLIVPGVDRLLDFLQAAFGAEVKEKHMRPDGSVGHAEVRIGGAAVMMGEASEQWPAMPGSVYLYVDNTDATYARAITAGATSVMEPADQFYGTRGAGVKDPSGNVWWLATPTEVLTSEEVERRASNYEGWAEKD